MLYKNYAGKTSYLPTPTHNIDNTGEDWAASLATIYAHCELVAAG